MSAAIRGRVMWDIAQVAAALDWSTQKTRRWLKREGACRKHGRNWYTSKSQLRRVFRETADEVLAQLPE